MSVTVEVEKSFFGSENIHLQLAVTSLMDNPDFLRQKWEEFYMKYGPEPMLGAIPDIRWEILNQIILNMPEARGIKLLPPLEQLKEMIAQTPPVPGGGTAPAPGINPTLQNALSLPGVAR